LPFYNIYNFFFLDFNTFFARVAMNIRNSNLSQLWILKAWFIVCAAPLHWLPAILKLFRKSGFE